MNSNQLKEIDKLRRCKAMISKSKMDDEAKKALKLKMQVCLAQMMHKAV